MNNYIANLKNLVCSESGQISQVENLVKRAIRQEHWVVNGDRPNGKDSEGIYGKNGRVKDFLNDPDLKNPVYHSTSLDNKTTVLQRKNATDGRPLNNNPLYKPNMIEVLNTPFDHIERIVLQDFSATMGLPDAGNYFTGLFSFPEDSDGKYHGGFSGFTMADPESVSRFEVVNNKFGTEVNKDIGGFFIDSFTYTPYIDYSQVDEGGDPRVGVYSDKFLTDYNTEKYDEEEQVDKNHHKLSSKLYELGNLKKDLEDAKVAFRKAVADQDKKTYIYTLCEHLADLFAKLSNIRMSHEIYGFKHPHHQWEGILALDFFYNLLYKEIDAKYPFDDRYMNMNPMQRRKAFESFPNKYVEMDNGRKLYLMSDYTVKWESETNVVPNLEWMEDETDEKYVYIWDSDIWKAYYDNSKSITETRRECTTPRGVLGKLYRIVRGFEYKKDYYLAKTDGDYGWFAQPGKIYTHWDERSLFTKYVNLHLGRAYDVMTGKEYWELTGSGKSENQYTKPDFTEISNKSNFLGLMMEAGYNTLVDVFAIVQNEHLFNVFNSQTSKVEEFNPSNASQYAQGQCAIALERVFSRIYKYLQFKSTTSETFQRHINIDSGYKYLTTDSLKNSDHSLNCYYDLEQDASDNVEKHYLRYLKKLDFYLNGEDVDGEHRDPPDIGLNDDEKDILREFCDILSKQTLSWLDEQWDLCPLLKKSDERPEPPSPRKLMVGTRDGSGGGSNASSSSYDEYTLEICFSTNGYMTWEGASRTTVSVPDSWNCEWSQDILVVRLQRDVDQILLSDINLKSAPIYVHEDTGTQSNYSIAGYTLERNGQTLRFTSNQSVDSSVFGD